MADTELAVQQPTQIERRPSFAPTTIAEAFRFADMVLASGMAPKSYREIYEKDKEKGAAAVVVALQFGMEVGLAPLQALQNIASINGYPSLWGDAALALVRASGLLEYIKEDDFPEIRKNSAATCIVKRRGDPIEKKVTFSYQDARDAKIFDNAVWKTYPYRMCQMRARAFALRDKFSDVLKGLSIAEEVQDWPLIEGDSQMPAVTVEEQSQVVDDHEIGADGAMGFWAFAKEHRRHKDTVLAFLKVNDISDTRKILASKLEDLKQKLLKDTQPVAAVAAAPSPTSPDPGENMDAEPA